MTEDKTKDTKPSLLSDDEKAKIAAQLEKELEKEAKDKAAAAYKATLKAQAKKEEFLKDAKPGDPDDNGLVPLFLSLPGVSDCVRLDGRNYYPNKMHYVTPAVRDTLLEIIGRGVEHESQINGKTARENMFRKMSKDIAGR